MCSCYQMAAKNGQRHGSCFSEAVWAAAYEPGCTGGSAEPQRQNGTFQSLSPDKNQSSLMWSKTSVSLTCSDPECVLSAVALMFGKVNIILPKVLLGCNTDQSLFTTSPPAPSCLQCTNPATPWKFCASSHPPHLPEPGDVAWGH